MNHMMTKLTAALRAFHYCERGTASLEFVIVFPVFFTFFLMTYESGMVSMRHVMLERGVDIAVREVRIGAMIEPTRVKLIKRICEEATIIPNCESQLQLEMIRRNPRSFADVPTKIQCINRSLATQPTVEFVTDGTNNELLILRACVRIDPVLPTTGLGKAIVDNNSGAEAGGSYALVSTAAYVIEPYEGDEEEEAGG